MEIFTFGDKNAENVLVQPVDEHELSAIENEMKQIAELTDKSFKLLAFKVDSWNDDLSPWKAPAVFGKDDFGGGADITLRNITALCTDKSKNYYLGGYSLAGLFSLWASYNTDTFMGVAAVSPSVWFSGFSEFMQSKKICTDSVYLSLGDREEHTRDPLMSTVGDCIRTDFELLKSQGVHCILEWNKGGHFKDADLRTAKGFAWLLSST